MTALSSPRLYLLPLSRAMLSTRLETDDFTLPCQTPDGVQQVGFGPQWPGDALVLFPMLLADLDGGAGDGPGVAGTFAVVERASLQAVGQVGTKGGADEAGAVEIGYGMNEAEWGRGLATEAVGVLVAHLLGAPEVARVTAQTAVDNLGSQRVLERNGFERVGTAHSDEDGELVLWARN